MAPLRSRRLRLLDGLRKTISSMLHERVRADAEGSGRPAPESTSAIYAVARSSQPQLLDQLLNVHLRACQERGESVRPAPPTSDTERQRMLSAVRAVVLRSETRFG